jgi:hypothetical protein
MVQLKTKEVIDNKVKIFERIVVVPFILRPFKAFDQDLLKLPFEIKFFSADFCVKGFLHSKNGGVFYG